MRSVLKFFVAAFLALFPASLFAAHTHASLILSAETARPGDTILAGIRMKMDPDWHTYWKNSGASGIPTSIKWTLPQGITAGKIQWPLPVKMPPDELVTYAYEDEVVLIVPLKLAADLPAGSKELKASISWLECKEQCVPGSEDVSATLNIGSETKSSTDAALIESWQKKVPQSGASLNPRASWEKNPNGDMRPLILEWDSTNSIANVDFYPYASEQFEVQAPVQKLPGDVGIIRIRKPVKKYEGDWPKEISGVIVETSGGERRGYEITVPVSEASGEEISQIRFSWSALLSGLGFAFLGGLILNIMPCVLPVIALKIFSFIKQSGEQPRRARHLSVIYAMGILCSFLVLAGFLIGVQKAGHVASWGMQMQDKNFLIGMTILVTLVALNLFGIFEVTLGSRAMSAAGSLSSKSGAAGAFFNGVLATALAIPCTAPFLAAALAFAFAQPPAIIVLTFCFIAFGLAAPYVVLTWNPNLLKFLPKPGAWMQRFKIALGFPMLATVVWLYKLSLNQLTKSQSLWFGIFLVALACAAWIWGEFVQRGNARRMVAAFISIALIASVGAYAGTRREDLKWQPWSNAAVEKARAQGHPVLVDFTADWCLTCQLNLHTSIDVRDVREKIASTGTVTLIADYTLQDENIAQELHRFGRDAVPLVVVFPKNPKADPIVLPPVLKPGIVLDALERAAK
jgi:DsbC/DsbD-like thiol-disulfide interchange protein/cytochrome c biogenesis protein CcdA/multisubunit Na+/H+ antiporter MnhG subunit